jgi:hypothetical protein
MIQRRTESTYHCLMWSQSVICYYNWKWLYFLDYLWIVLQISVPSQLIMASKVSEGAAGIKGVKTVCNTEWQRSYCTSYSLAYSIAWHHVGSNGAGLLEITVILLFSRFTSKQTNDSRLEQVTASSDDTAAPCRDCCDVPQHKSHATSQNKVTPPSPYFHSYLFSWIH